MAIVVVTHLSPTRPSLLHEVLSRVSPLPVEIARDGVKVEKNHVYVMPENATLGLKGRALSVGRLASPRDRKPVDAFFESMAADVGASAVGVVLSGGDGDGTLGTVAIRAHGGLTFAQKPDGGASGPQQPSMPEGAIATGSVDYVLPVGDMGRVLADIARGRAPPDMDKAHEGEDAFGVICGLLLKQTGHDFTGYKRKSLQRGVARHMQSLGIVSEADYIARLVDSDEDVARLFGDLLIGVTSFFRDPLAFKAMAQDVIPGLFHEKGPDDHVRVWIPGCATGQEVYSIAMLAREHADSLTHPPKVQIFGTDIDGRAIRVARAGLYSSLLMEGVSEDRRQRFFEKHDGNWRIRERIREDCVFAEHNVIRDAAFVRLDLISCRNLLIYFAARSQGVVMATFHRALREGGFLLLGRSEFISQHAGLFEPVDLTHRIFRRLPGAGVALVAGARALLLPTLPIPARIADRPGGYGSPPGRPLEPLRSGSLKPAHLLVSASGEVRGASAGAFVYLGSTRPEGGSEAVSTEAGSAPLDNAPIRKSGIGNGGTGESSAATPALPSTLGSDSGGGLGRDIVLAIGEALDAGEPVWRSRLIHMAGRDRMIGMEIEPLVAPAGVEALFFVGLGDIGFKVPSNGSGSETQSRAFIVWHLVETRERLKSTIAAYESGLEAMKLSNEELLSANEESQSVNEEVEASKEELQSLNEEMVSINAELISKVEDLDRSHADLKNLFESTQIATLFLDSESRIRTYTPAARKLFSLIRSDEGRPLSDMAGHVAFPDLTQKIDEVMRLGNIIEYRAPRPDIGALFLVRILPYRKADRPPSGVVLTFLDITQLDDARAHIELLGRAEEHQRVLIAELNHRVKNMLGVVIGIATLTIKTAPSPEAFFESLMGRIRAMSRAYELLSRENWVEATIRDLVEDEMAPFDASCVDATGPDVRLGPDEALAMSVILHELATNAVKYGALSHSKGLVSIVWQIASGDESILEVVWRETGGPKIDEVPERGFGLNLIEQEVTSQFGGAVDVTFDEAGLLARISFPISRDQAPAPSASVGKGGVERTPPAVAPA